MVGQNASEKVISKNFCHLISVGFNCMFCRRLSYSSRQTFKRQSCSQLLSSLLLINGLVGGLGGGVGGGLDGRIKNQARIYQTLPQVALMPIVPFFFKKGSKNLNCKKFPGMGTLEFLGISLLVSRLRELVWSVFHRVENCAFYFIHLTSYHSPSVLMPTLY